MKLLSTLQTVRSAYSKATFSRLIVDAYTKSDFWLLICLWISTFGYLALAALDVFYGSKNLEYIAPFVLLIMGLLFHFALESAHKRTITNNRALIDLYKKDRIFLRYLIFKQRVPPELVGDQKQIGRLRGLLKEESELDGPTILSGSATSISIVALLAALLSGAASQPTFWSSGLMWWLLLSLVFALIASSRYGEFFNPARRRNRELNQFLVWLSLDERPRIAI